MDQNHISFKNLNGIQTGWQAQIRLEWSSPRHRTSQSPYGTMGELHLQPAPCESKWNRFAKSVPLRKPACSEIPALASSACPRKHKPAVSQPAAHLHLPLPPPQRAVCVSARSATRAVLFSQHLRAHPPRLSAVMTEKSLCHLLMNSHRFTSESQRLSGCTAKASCRSITKCSRRARNEALPA